MSNAKYDKKQPFLATLKERYSLSKEGSKKNTLHLVFDLTNSDLNYEVGDSVGIFPCHSKDLVSKTIRALRVEESETVISKQNLQVYSLVDYFTSYVNLTTISPKLFKAVAEKQINPEKKNILYQLLLEDQREAYKNYIAQREIWDFLQENSEVKFSAQEFVDLLMPLLPRLYSISSSQKHVGNEVHLTIATVEYVSNGHSRKGVCTHYLSKIVEMGQPVVRLFIQPTLHFKLPSDPHQHSLIMIGPGTGIAPFRAFMQERLLHHQSTAKHWIFFGEWTKEHDFLYEEEWLKFGEKGCLYLDVAFSRDQVDKIYVQQKMWEKGQDVYAWLEQGAVLYVCGDAQRMARDVERELIRIVQVFGEKDEKEAQQYVKNLRQQKRYLRDVY